MTDLIDNGAGATGSDGKIIRAEHEYDTEYRQNLWIALWDDFARIGRGHDYYIGQMKRDFDFYAKPAVGYKFVTSQGAPLDVSALTKDDLYGFMGSKSNRPTGPNRHLTPAKITVLDVFFKAKFPLYASAFRASETLSSLVKIFRMYFSKPGDDIVQDMGLETFAGAFVIDAVSLKNRFRRMTDVYCDPRDLHIPIFILKYVSGYRHLVTHKFLVPAKEDYFTSNSELAELYRKSKSAFVAKYEETKPQTYAFSGASFPAFDVEDELGVKFLSVLRDRTTYSPEIDYVRFGSTAEPAGKSHSAPAHIASKGEDYFEVNLLLEYLQKYRYDKPPTIDKKARVMHRENVEYSDALVSFCQKICDNSQGLT